MPLIRRPGLALAQPQGAAGVDVSNPLTHGLAGLLWVGPGMARDLLNPGIAFTAAGTLMPRAVGIGRVATSSQVGATSGYSGVQARIAPWKIAAKPVTFLAFFARGSGSPVSSFYAAVTHGSSGLQLWNTYGSNTRRVQCYSAAGVSALVETGTWAAGAHVRGFTHDGATLIGYDSGRQFGATANATSAIYCDPTYTEVKLLASSAGTGYWMAVWNRVLSPAEVLALEALPWQLIAQPARRIFVPVVGGGPADLTAALAAVEAGADACAVAAAVLAQVVGAAAEVGADVIGGTAQAEAQAACAAQEAGNDAAVASAAASVAALAAASETGIDAASASVQSLLAAALAAAENAGDTLSALLVSTPPSGAWVVSPARSTVVPHQPRSTVVPHQPRSTVVPHQPRSTVVRAD